MKKVLLVCAMGGIFILMWRDEKDKDDDEMSACDWKAASEALVKEMKEAGTDADKLRRAWGKSRC